MPAVSQRQGRQLEDTGNSLHCLFLKHLGNQVKMQSQTEWVWVGAQDPKSLASSYMMIRLLGGGLGFG